MNWTNCLTVCGVVFLAAQAQSQENTALTTPAQKTSYCIGVDMARNFKRQGREVDLGLVMQGFRDANSGAKLLLPEGEIDELRKVYMAETMRKQAMARRTPGQDNVEKGQAFLAENKKKGGVVTLPEGIQYQVIKTGAGKKPTGTNTVECFYRGTRLDGVEFFATSEAKPATFIVKDALVPAFSEVLPLMTAGSKWKIFVPPQFAFGARGVGRQIGPNETLIFELELASVK